MSSQTCGCDTAVGYTCARHAPGEPACGCHGDHECFLHWQAREYAEAERTPVSVWNRPQDKPSNPKDLIGTNKVPLDNIPAAGLTVQALAHLEGNLKYGLANWREIGVRSSIYVAAMLRHVEKFKEGEWADPETQVPHLGSIAACCNILVDAHVAGTLIDDRPKAVPAGAFMEEMSRVVQHLRTLFADRTPTHYYEDETLR